MAEKLNRKKSGNLEELLVIILFVSVIFITGVYAWQELKIADSTAKFLGLVQKYVATTNTTKKSEDKIAWQTYENKDFAWSFNYPKNWRLEKGSNVVKNGSSLFVGPEGHFWASVSGNSKNLDPQGIKDDYYKNDQYGYQYQDTYPKVAGIISYEQARYDLGIIERYHIPTNGKIYELNFEFNFSDKSLASGYHDIIDKVIASVKFTDQSADGGSFACSQDSDCVAIANPSNACYKSYFNKNDLAGMELFKKTRNIMIQDCPQYGPAVCKNNTCQAEFIKR